jgi:hypothetical protein
MVTRYQLYRCARAPLQPGLIRAKKIEYSMKNMQTIQNYDTIACNIKSHFHL